LQGFRLGRQGVRAEKEGTSREANEGAGKEVYFFSFFNPLLFLSIALSIHSTALFSFSFTIPPFQLFLNDKTEIKSGFYEKT